MTYMSAETPSREPVANAAPLALGSTQAPAMQRGERTPYAGSLDDVVASLGTDRTDGLTAAAVVAARGRHGYNELPVAPPAPWWRRLGRQFGDLVIWVLLVAAVISAVAGETVDAAVILAIVVLNGLLGYFQEERAGRTDPS